MTKRDLIQAIEGACREQAPAVRPDPSAGPTRSPAAGGGLSAPIRPTLRRRVRPRDPQTGDALPAVPVGRWRPRR